MNHSFCIRGVIASVRHIYRKAQDLAWQFSMFVYVFYRAWLLMFFFLGKSFLYPPRLHGWFWRLLRKQRKSPNFTGGYYIQFVWAMSNRNLFLWGGVYMSGLSHGRGSMGFSATPADVQTASHGGKCCFSPCYHTEKQRFPAV